METCDVFNIDAVYYKYREFHIDIKDYTSILTYERYLKLFKKTISSQEILDVRLKKRIDNIVVCGRLQYWVIKYLHSWQIIQIYEDNTHNSGTRLSVSLFGQRCDKRYIILQTIYKSYISGIPIPPHLSYKSIEI